MVGEDDGSFHGVFLLNSHAMGHLLFKLTAKFGVIPFNLDSFELTATQM